MQYLDFEKPIEELDLRIEKLTREGRDEEAHRLIEKREKVIRNIYSHLTPWQRVLLARHPERPHTTQYLNLIFDHWIELHGDRVSGEDPAIVAGFGKVHSCTVFFAGHEKGKTTREKQVRNFGMAQPYGYRKAMKVMDMAVRFKKPFVTFIDTPGAYPGIEAEEKGQAFAIAQCISHMLSIPTPVVSVVIGEGGSGGALALASADRIFMLENATFSVISPEGCASILFRDASQAQKAADALKLTARDLFELGLIDGVIEEPPGGAHRDPAAAARAVKEKVLSAVEELKEQDCHQLVKKRREKFFKMGVFRVEV